MRRAFAVKSSAISWPLLSAIFRDFTPKSGFTKTTWLEHKRSCAGTERPAGRTTKKNRKNEGCGLGFRSQLGRHRNPNPGWSVQLYLTKSLSSLSGCDLTTV